MDKYEIMKNLLPIHTERLILKETTINDVDLLLKMDKQELTQMFLGGLKEKTKEERIEFLKKKEENWSNRVISSLTVYLKDNTPIGFIGIKLTDNDNADLGYIFDSDYWKNGYCREACLKLIEIAFQELKIKTIYADTIEGNDNSKNVLEKLGFQYSSKFIKDDKTFLVYQLNNKEQG